MDTVKIRLEDGSSVELEYHEVLPSAAALARQYAEAGYPDRYAVFTESLLSQKKSESAKKGVYLSLILRPSFFNSQAGFLRIMAASSFAMALEEHTEEKIGIAWISDIFCKGRKIGSVTIEGKLDEMSFFEYIIVNFSAELSEENFPPRLDDLVKKVFERDNLSINMIIARSILYKFFPFYVKLKHKRRFLTPYNDRFLLRGKRIVFLQDGKRKRGKAVGVDQENGKLLLEYRDKTVSISSPSDIFLPKKLRFPK